ncbi:MAG: hypothetical protein PHQ40_16925 [Anaerolineaceae bacterium]|nr:hypothetical protein [Anaerolineaceae bacterium]
MDQKHRTLAQPDTTQLRPPQLVSSLRGGFDAVANHISLIILPVLLDLFLWFGPHLSLKTLLLPFAQQLATFPGMETPEMKDLVTYSQDIWRTIAEQINLAGSLRTFPVGIPSLMSSQFPGVTPLGIPMVAQITSAGVAVSVWLALVFVGLSLGSAYFSRVAQTVAIDSTPQSIGEYTWMALQSVLLTVACLVVLLIIGIPAMLILSLIALFSPAIAQIGLLLLSVVLVWVMIPLAFSPHGIFMFHQNALYSMLTSVRLVRFILPGTGLFFLTIVVLSQGLDLLWQVPPPSSWLSLVAIAGHAFVTTALLAASFVYYRDAMQWVRDYLQQSGTSRLKT